MKLFLVLGVLAAAYTCMLLHNTDVVLTQVQNLNATYQYAADHSDQIAAGQSR